MIEPKTTKDITQQGIKILVYGDSGSGKTTLIKTCANPLILSAESGLLPLKGLNIPYLPIKSLSDFSEACSYVLQHINDYKTIVIDSLSEIAEITLVFDKSGVKDPRQAYLKMNEEMISIIRFFRDLPINVYFSAKMERVQDESGRLCYGASMPGKQLTQNLPYFFDEVFVLRADKDKDGNVHRFLQTSEDGIYSGLKDRSGTLQMWEDPDLQAIINKIQTEVTR